MNVIKKCSFVTWMLLIYNTRACNKATIYPTCPLQTKNITLNQSLGSDGLTSRLHSYRTYPYTVHALLFWRVIHPSSSFLPENLLWFVFADVYNIVSNRGSVGRFCLFKSAYRIGEEIVGSFDFSDSLIICLKVNILTGFSRQVLVFMALISEIITIKRFHPLKLG